MSEQTERKYPYEPKAPAVLAVDVGGSHVKTVLNGIEERRRFVSGPKMTAQQMVDGVLEMTKDLEYMHVSVGCPAPIKDDKPVHDPVNLGKGWAGFDFGKAFGKPSKAINDATMQALGSYQGGRMLFAIEQFTAALEPDYVVLGGGNARNIDELPEHVHLGHNEDAFLGG